MRVRWIPVAMALLFLAAPLAAAGGDTFEVNPPFEEVLSKAKKAEQLVFIEFFLDG